MQAFFSSIDTGNIDNYNSDWMVSLVVNKRGDYQVRLDIFKPFRISNIPVKILVDIPTNLDLIVACQADVQQHVKQQGAFRSRRIKTTETGSAYGGVMDIADLVMDGDQLV